MSEERDLHLGRVIKNADYHDYKAQILLKAKAAPYSQPLQRVAEKLKADNKLPILKYAWVEKSDVSDTLEDSVMTLSTISLKGKGAPKAVAAKPAKLESKPQPQKEMSTISTNTQNKYLQTKEIETSGFTTWLNSKTIPLTAGMEVDKQVKMQVEVEAETPSIEPNSATIKPAKRSKSKSKKKSGKSKLQKKIDASLIDHKNIASEPLAKLYKKQGFYKKSLKMYEQLSLINPEKSSFFAPFIEELKNKLK